MTVPPAPTPREFGEALRKAREGAEVTLEAIRDRTKIATRLLHALETGEYGALPDRVFARIFLRQYLEFIGLEAKPWLVSFETAFSRFERASQPFPVPRPVSTGRSRLGPWLVAVLLVAVAILAIVEVESRFKRHARRAVPPTPEALVAAPAPSPTPLLQPTAVPQETSGLLVIRTTSRPCWVEVRSAGASPLRRLLDAQSLWEVAVGGQGIDVVLGDAGAVEIDYLGEHHVKLGGAGEVVRLHLGPTTDIEPLNSL